MVKGKWKLFNYLNFKFNKKYFLKLSKGYLRVFYELVN